MTAPPVPAVHCEFTRMVPAGELVPNPGNPNTHPEAQVQRLAAIIAAHGWRAPVTVSNQSGYIVRGHGRRLAAIELHGDAAPVPVDFQDYASTAAELADLVADNKLAAMAVVDSGALAAMLGTVAAVDDFDLGLTGYTPAEFSELRRLLDGSGDYADLDAELAGGSGELPANVALAVPAQHVDAVKLWLANGERMTAPGMGLGVLKRCGLL